MGLRLDKPRRERSASMFAERSVKRKYSSASCRLPSSSGFPFFPSSSSPTGVSSSKRPALFNATDAYILRQVASNRNEYDLQQKIDLEIKMREGTSKLLAACKHQTQTLEAAKSLLTSDTRLNEFRSELQSRKANKSKNRKACQHFAKASVSQIRIPLLWKDTDIFKNKPDTRRFAVFALLQIGTEIYDTFMTIVDRTVTDIVFDEVFNFQQVPPDFRLKIQLYGRLIGDDLSSMPTAKKITTKISNSVSRSFGRRFAAMRDELDVENGSPKFYLLASGLLMLRDASDAVATHDLNIEKIDKNLQLPLFGDFCCRFALQSDCQQHETFAGFVRLLTPSSDDHRRRSDSFRSRSSGQLYWAVTKNFKISLFELPDDNDSGFSDEVASVKGAKSKLPEISLPVNANSKVAHRESSVELITGDRRLELQPTQGLGSTTELFKALVRMRDEFAVWEPIAEYQMELALEGTESRPTFVRSRNKSLYDETPITDLRKRHSKSLSNVSTIDAKYNAVSNGTLGRPFRALHNAAHNAARNNSFSKARVGTESTLVWGDV